MAVVFINGTQFLLEKTLKTDKELAGLSDFSYLSVWQTFSQK